MRLGKRIKLFFILFWMYYEAYLLLIVKKLVSLEKFNNTITGKLENFKSHHVKLKAECKENEKLTHKLQQKIQSLEEVSL